MPITNLIALIVVLIFFAYFLYIAAKVICHDEEKQELEQRVEELEHVLFVIRCEGIEKGYTWIAQRVTKALEAKPPKWWDKEW